MDGISQKLINGNRQVATMVRSLLSTPTLINIDTTQGTVYAIPLECESYQQSGAAQVSESLVICKTNKVNVSDNVAPGAWSWELQGYIPGSKLLEPTNYYTPIVKLNTDIVKQWFKKGAILIFKDGDCQIHQRVVIQNLTISQQKDCRNKTPFTMTIKEINLMDEQLVENTTAYVKSTPSNGNSIGAALACGTTVATIVNTVGEQTA